MKVSLRRPCIEQGTGIGNGEEMSLWIKPTNFSHRPAWKARLPRGVSRNWTNTRERVFVLEVDRKRKFYFRPKPYVPPKVKRDFRPKTETETESR